MKTKAEIVENWLPRYTQHPLSDFGEYVLLTNFNNYVDIFCEQFKLPQPGYGANMRMATAENITIINFGMGSPNAAIIMDLLSAIEPKACLFLGKCGGISSKAKLGDLILWRESAERGHRTIIIRPRCLRCRLSCSNVRCRLPYGMPIAIIGRARCTLRTVGYGSMMKSSRRI